MTEVFTATAEGIFFMMVNEYSKIGFCYKMLYVKYNSFCIKIDLTISAIFKVLPEEWDEYWQIAQPMADARDLLNGHVIYDGFIREIKEAAEKEISE